MPFEESEPVEVLRPVRLQNLRRQWNVGEQEKTQRERMVRHL